MKLPYNYVSTLAFLKGARSSACLRVLDIRDNKLDSVNEIDYLGDVPRLKVLRLSDTGASRAGNVMCSQPGFVPALLRAAPGLQQLDEMSVPQAIGLYQARIDAV